jgi:phosphoribosyl 1,2-cyclic phosphodiesterase
VSDEFQIYVLGSGSGGNSSVLAFDDTSGHRRLIQIDLGLGPRTCAARAQELGFNIDCVEAAIITHGDSDHITATWGRTFARREIPVYVTDPHINAVLRAGIPERCIQRLCQSASITNDLTVHTATSPHDREGSASLRFDLHTQDLKLAWLTDLGRVLPAVETLIDGCDAIAIESNYDLEMQKRSPRPLFLKERIMGGAGHLSNTEALDAVMRLDADRPLSRVVLLHLSRECNCPHLLRSLWEREAPSLADRLSIAHQATPLGPIRVAVALPMS